MKDKITSRKFWTAVSGIVVGILLIFGYGETMTERIAGTILVLGDCIAYIIAEASIDSASFTERGNDKCENE